ncbi:hypothetical protein FRUB_07721 [Fimbriiglobus ruber]|uniref:Uncharacterized protein n=1 Tax=Fimbriiglobus ruber TaxID=1908690 RepID=A0A225DAL5_9BACT|nr:hypothetical protein FRUB_07721 [Fimbriiglobus ruber]
MAAENVCVWADNFAPSIFKWKNGPGIRKNRRQRKNSARQLRANTQDRKMLHAAGGAGGICARFSGARGNGFTRGERRRKFASS